MYSVVTSLAHPAPFYTAQAKTVCMTWPIIGVFNILTHRATSPTQTAAAEG